MVQEHNTFEPNKIEKQHHKNSKKNEQKQFKTIKNINEQHGTKKKKLEEEYNQLLMNQRSRYQMIASSSSGLNFLANRMDLA